MRKRKMLMLLAVVFTVVAGAVANSAATLAASRVTCGQYMHREHGKCVDARVKTSNKPWHQTIF